jgi:cyclophilin family peptidyl-prolyl cis-trans isomerase
MPVFRRVHGKFHRLVVPTGLPTFSHFVERPMDVTNSLLRMLRKTAWAPILAVVLLAPAWGFAQEPPAPATTPAPEAAAPEGPVFVIETSYGPVTVQTFPEDAPKTVARITELIRSGFYDGLTFHRVVPGFVVQGGDPDGTGRGGSGRNIPAEFNARKHVAGTVAMARASDPNSADSQFYIALDRLPHLDGKYTVFGQVIDGMDAVRKIRVGDAMLRVYVKEPGAETP